MQILSEFSLVAAVAITATLATYTWRRRTMAGAVPFFILLLAIGFWLLAYWLELEQTDLQGKLFWLRISYFGVLVIYPAAIILILQYMHKTKWLSSPWIYLLAIEPLIILALIWTNSYHHLFWSSIQLHTEALYASLSFIYGPLFWAHAAFNTLLLIIAEAVLLHQLVKSNRLHRGQIISILLGSAIPWVVNLLYIAGISPIPNINTTPFVFAFTSPLLAWSLFRYQRSNLIPVAYDAIIENMSDGVIVLDQLNRVLALNRSAGKITNQPASEIIGLPADVSFASWPALIKFIQSGNDIQTDVLFGENETGQYFDLHAASLSDNFKHKTGRFIVLRDITRSKKSESVQMRRAEELAMLHATLLDITASRDLDVLLETIIERAVHLLGAYGGSLYLCDLQNKQVRCDVSFNNPRNNAGAVEEYGQGEAGIIAQSGMPLIIDDYRIWPGKIGYPDTQQPIIALLGAPLFWQGQVIGVINVLDVVENRKFTDADQDLLTMFADQVAIAIENARLFKEAREAAERRAILHQASQEVVVANLDPERIYATIHEAAAKLMPSEAFAICLMNESTHLIDAVYIHDHKGRAPVVSIPAHRGISGHVINTGKSLYIEDMLEKLDTVDSIRVGDKEEVRSILAVPMRLGDKVIGMLSTQSYQVNSFTEEDEHLLEMLASYAAIALDNARLFGEVQKLAITDPLTGALNRRQLIELGQREFNRARRFDRPFSMIFLDIDRFKVVNDTYGHATGDLVLRILTQRIQATIREIDILARYGGEEFVVCLPETPCAAALGVAERLRNLAGHMPIPTEHGDVIITVSIGLTEISPDVQDFQSLIARADAAMYDAKKAGRDRVGIH